MIIDAVLGVRTEPLDLSSGMSALKCCTKLYQLSQARAAVHLAEIEGCDMHIGRGRRSAP
jgi:hypothetical protein